MGINFPPSPAVGTLYPDPATIGLPQYKWDGTVWQAVSTPEALTYVKRTGDTMSGALKLAGDPVAALDAVPKQYAAPLDALAYSGMQFNGSMEVNQPGAASYAVGRNIDGWAMWSAGAQVPLTSHTTVAPPGFSNSVQAWCSTANAAPTVNDVVFFIHLIEGYRIARLGWGTAAAKPLTIGFWVNSTRTGTFSGAVQNNGPARSCTFSYTINTANTWEYKVVTIAGDTAGTWLKTNGVGLGVAFAVMGGSNYLTAAGVWTAGNLVGVPGTTNCVATTSDLFHITGLVVLPGIVAPTAAQSSLIMRPYDQELATCQRYYTKLNQLLHYAPYVPAGGAFYVDWIHPSTMRAMPTVAAYNTIPTNSSGLNLNATNASHTNMVLVATALGSSWAYYDLVMDARL